MKLPRTRNFYIGLALLALVLVVLANAHLVIVASTSQPVCVEHVKPGDMPSPQRFSAAGTAC